MADFSRPLLSGGLAPAAASAYTQHRLEETARAARINLRTPFEALPKESARRRLLLDVDSGSPAGGLRRSCRCLPRMAHRVHVLRRVPGLSRQAAASPQAWRCG